MSALPPGYIFPCASHEGRVSALCFVPAELVTQAAHGFTLNRVAYINQGWAARNSFANVGVTVGSHLFPDLNVPPVQVPSATLSPAHNAFLESLFSQVGV